MLHALLDTLPQTITFDTDPTHAHTTAAEAFALKRGVCQDISHIFIASARSLGIPARYVSGYLHRADGQNDQQAGHAWAEAYVDGLGWVAFDATNGMCATDAYLRVAVGLDYLSAAPLRGSRIGGDGEGLDVRIRVDQADASAAGLACNFGVQFGPLAYRAIYSKLSVLSDCPFAVATCWVRCCNIRRHRMYERNFV